MNWTKTLVPLIPKKHSQLSRQSLAHDRTQERVGYVFTSKATTHHPRYSPPLPSLGSSSSRLPSPIPHVLKSNSNLATSREASVTQNTLSKIITEHLCAFYPISRDYGMEYHVECTPVDLRVKPCCMDHNVGPKVTNAEPRIQEQANTECISPAGRSLRSTSPFS